MGEDAASVAAGQSAAQDEILTRFARLMRRHYGARLYLFGSRARGTAHPDSDYDVVAVSSAFAGQRREVDEDVDVAIGPRFAPLHRAK